MSLESLNRWLAPLANLGVIAGFVALAIQMNQNTTAIRNQNANEVTKVALTAELTALGDDGHAAMARAMLRPAELTEEQTLQLWYYTDAILGGVYNTWLSRRDGLVSEQDWIEARRGIAFMLDFEAVRIIWDRYKTGAFPPEFITDFESEMKTGRPHRVSATFREILGDLRRLPRESMGGSLE